MNSIQNLFEQAQLAEAAYAKFSLFPNNPIGALEDEGFSAAQAADFANHWQVINHQPDTGTGFSATLFQNTDTLEYSLSIRGSTPAQVGRDFIADTKLISSDGIAVSQVVDLYNYWQRLTHTGIYDVAKLETQDVASVYLTALYLNSSADIPAQLLNLFAGVSIPTTYDAARNFFVGHGYIVEGGKVYTLEPASSTSYYGVTDPRSFGISVPGLASVSVDGHSLGGHLAMTFSRLFPDATNDVTAVNGLGFKIGDMNVYNLFAGLRGLVGFSDVPGFDATKMQNVYGIEGWEFAAMNNGVLQQPAAAANGWNGIFIESAGLSQYAALGHGASQMTDSLAVYNLFAQLDPTLNDGSQATLDKITAILKAESNVGANSLESVIADLGKILSVPNTAFTASEFDSNRDQLYTSIDHIKQALPTDGSLHLISLANVDTSNIASVISAAEQSDATGLAYRYALNELNHFVVTGINYNQHNTNHALDLYAPATGQGLTDSWITDRTTMLGWLEVRNTDDKSPNIVLTSDTEQLFRDTVSNTTILTGSAFVINNDQRHQYIFGNATSESLAGGNLSDHLYGMDGNDTLAGKGGADYLEGGNDNDVLIGGTGADTINGGQGADLYRFKSGDGSDEILDADGGWLYRNDKFLTYGKHVAGQADVWQSIDGFTTYTKQGDNLLIAFTNGDSITIDNFNFQAAQSGATGDALQASLGIQLAGDPRIVLRPTLDHSSNLAQTGGNASGGSTTLAEGGVRPLTLFSADVADVDRTFTLTLNGGDTSHIVLSTGADLIAFQNGSATLTLPAGQDSLSFALITRGDVDQNASYTLTASLNDPAWPDVTSSLGVNLTAVVEANQSPVIRNGTGGSDYIDGVDNNQQAFGGDGNDVISGRVSVASNGSGYKKLYGGAGDDVLDSGDGAGELHGDAGNDLLEGDMQRNYADIGSGVAFLNGVQTQSALPFKLYPGSDPWAWVGPHAHINLAPATVSIQAGIVTADGGSWQTDANGNWLVGQQNPWIPYLLFGIRGPTGKSPDFEYTAFSGSYVDQHSGQTINFNFYPSDTDQNGHHHYIIEYTASFPHNQLWTATISGGVGVFGSTDFNAKPHTMDGGTGDDTLIAGKNGDVLVGGASNDLIQGGSGNDRAWGDAGPIEGQDSAGGGNDQIALGDGNDYADGGDGNDVILGEAGSDILFGGRGNDVLIGGKLDANAAAPGNDYLEGEDGNDTLLGGTGNDELFGGVGDDYLLGDRVQNSDGGNDYLDGGSGADILIGAGGDDVLLGGAGDDQLDGGDGNDTLEGGAGIDVLSGGQGDDVYVFNPGDGQGLSVEAISDIGGDDTLRFGKGITLDDIRLSLGQDGQSLLVQYGLNDQFSIGDGPTGSVEHFEFADGSTYSLNQLIALRGDATLAGFGNAGDGAYGSTGGDQVNVDPGQTTVMPGRGNDTVTMAGSGHTYVYSAGDGTDHIQADGTGNTLRFKDGVTPGDIKLMLGSLAIQVGDDPANVIHIEGFDPQNPLSSPVFDTFEFLSPAPGSEDVVASLTLADLLASGFDIDGTDYADVLTGTAVTDRISGGTGDDLLKGGAGDDTYFFNAGDGADTIDDDEGVNSIVFGAGLSPQGFTLAQSLRADGLHYLDLDFGNGDRVSIRSGELQTVQSFQFADGTVLAATDLLAVLPPLDIIGTPGDDVLTGFNGPDILDGGAGNDTLQGGSGDDVYRFGPGYGQDVVYDYDATAGNVDTVRMTGGVVPDEVSVSGDATNLYLSFNNSADQLTLSNWLLGDEYKIEQVTFADGTVWGVTDLMAKLLVNHAPTVVNTLANAQADEDSAFVYEVAGTFSDQDVGDVLSYSAALSDGSALPEWLGFDAATGTFSGVPAQADVGSLQLVVMATDTAGANAQAAFTLTVANVNDAPQAAIALDGQSAEAYAAFHFALPDGAFTDADIGDQLVYSAALEDGSALPSWLSFDAASTTFDGTPGVADAGGLQIRITATDSGGLTASETFGLVVQPGMRLTGTNGNDVLAGNLGNDTLDGGLGADTMSGGKGDDTYLVDDAGDIVTEKTNQGIDTVMSTVSTTLRANVEHLVLTGDAAINGTGNGLDNMLTGNAGSNVLKGGGGADTMQGGAGDDIYVVNSVADAVIENADEGTDLVKSAVSYALGDNQENLTLTGTAAIDGTGNALDNVLLGNGAPNVLNGLGGNDSITGGNSDDVLIGDAGNDTLNGAVGADSMFGGAGDDVYTVNDVGDVVFENAGEGTDLVKSAVDYILTDEVENLTLTGAVAINATGNALDNLITGNGLANVLTGLGGNDTLDGAGGADTMMGGMGDDTYIVKSTADMVIENTGEGIDLVMSSSTHTLAANVENLTLTGSGAIRGTGNALDNVLTGNSAANRLSGDAGDDTLDGGDGNDTLTGGAGADNFEFTTGLNATSNVDKVMDFSAAAGDRILLSSNIFTALGGTVTSSDILAGAGITAASTPDQNLIYNSTTGNLYYDADGVGGVDATLFAIISLNGVAASHPATLTAEKFGIMA